MIRCPVCTSENPDDKKFCGECGVNLSDSLTGRLSSDSMLEGRYRIITTIGRGGMGAVYLALDQRLNNMRVAIKEMSTNAVGQGNLTAAISAFKKEAAILIDLRHPALPRVIDFFPRGVDRWYLVMDFIEGKNLSAVLSERGRIEESLVINWSQQLCEILHFLHEQDPPIIFRDLKPSNIMLTPQGQIKLVDFGIARHFRPGVGSDTTAYGSTGFAPPEQYGDRQTNVRSDIYALGATIHCLITGIDPKTNPFLFEEPAKYQKVSPRLNQAVMKALEFKPEDRPETIAQFWEILTGENRAEHVFSRKHFLGHSSPAASRAYPVGDALEIIPEKSIASIIESPLVNEEELRGSAPEPVKDGQSGTLAFEDEQRLQATVMQEDQAVVDSQQDDYRGESTPEEDSETLVMTDSAPEQERKAKEIEAEPISIDESSTNTLALQPEKLFEKKTNESEPIDNSAETPIANAIKPEDGLKDGDQTMPIPGNASTGPKDAGKALIPKNEKKKSSLKAIAVASVIILAIVAAVFINNNNRQTTVQTPSQATVTTPTTPSTATAPTTENSQPTITPEDSASDTSESTEKSTSSSSSSSSKSTTPTTPSSSGSSTSGSGSSSQPKGETYDSRPQGETYDYRI